MGWIKLYRKIQSNDIWKEKPFSKGQAWIDLILSAKHETEPFYSPANKCIIDGQRGVVYLGIKTLSTRWGWSECKTEKFLSDLEALGMVEVTKKKGSKKTSINIVKYDTFQATETDKTRGKKGSKNDVSKMLKGSDLGSDRDIQEYKEHKEHKEEKNKIYDPNEIDTSDWDKLPSLTYEEVKKWESENGKQWEGLIKW